MDTETRWNGLTFTEWMREADKACYSMCGLGINDLPDWHHWDNWDSEVSPKDHAREVIENALDDFGMDADMFGFEFD